MPRGTWCSFQSEWAAARMREHVILKESQHVNVLVVGAGPCGLVAGITLARYAVDVIVVEQR